MKVTTEKISLLERMYQLREDELVQSKVRKRMKKRILSLLMGNPDEKQIRRIIQRRQKREVKIIKNMLSDLENNAFVIERRAHTISNEIAQILKKSFHNITLSLY